MMMGQQREQSLLTGSLHSGVEMWIHLSRQIHTVQVINTVCVCVGGETRQDEKYSRSRKNAMGRWD